MSTAQAQYGPVPRLMRPGCILTAITVQDPAARPIPIRFDYDEPNRALLVEWTEGITHRIPFTALRRACPCAICAGELGLTGRFVTDPRLRRGEDELADISLVGAYGLNAVWANGHNTGIYTFERLRALGEETSTSREGPPIR